jgi:alanine dehydrogenase
VIVGVPAEVKPGENRVALTPDGARELTAHGHRVLVERGAGTGSSIPDADFSASGAELVDASEAWAADLVLKVKEPQEQEHAFLRPGLTLFGYLHVAAYPGLADVLLNSNTTAIAYETVSDPSGALPLLAPMSEVAGRLAPQIGAHFLERGQGGRGVLLGGTPGVRPARVVVLGAGSVGSNAAWIAQGMEAEVILIDRNLDRLRLVDQIHRGRIMTLASNRGVIERSLAEADLLIGAVLVPGAKAPVIVSEDMVAQMKPGSVIVDVAVDQGGCVATTVETTHEHPIVVHHDVLHYGVGNIPAAVPHTSTYALTNATFPYLLALADHGVRQAIDVVPGLAGGVTTAGGHVTNAAVAEVVGRTALDPSVALGGGGAGS